MKISHSWLQEYFKDTLPTAEALAELFTFHSFEIDGIDGRDGRDGHLSSLGEPKGDKIIDAKILPDRAHFCLSYKGIAEEVKVLTGLDYIDNKIDDTTLAVEESIEKINVTVEAGDFCRRYVSRKITGLEIKESEEYIKDKLRAMDGRSINTIVDATNIAMFDYGQPLHAFDADKVKGDIVVRSAKEGESITLLDGKEITLSSNDHVVADEEGPLAIAGVKGGKRAEVTMDTKNIIIESANFEPASVRKTSTKYNLRNESSKRFENEITPDIALSGINHVSTLISKLNPNAKFGPIADFYPKPAINTVIATSTNFINKKLGINIPQEKIVEILKNFSIVVEEKEEQLSLTIPLHRFDLVIPEDIVEEVGRIYGYDKVVGTKQEVKNSADIPAHSGFYVAENIKNILLSLGFSEAYLYTLVNKGDIEVAYPLASDKKALRTNLSDGMLKALDMNARNADLLFLDTVKMFEIGKVFTNKGEHTSLCVGVSRIKKVKGQTSNQDIRDTREALLKALDIDIMTLCTIDDTGGLLRFKGEQIGVINAIDGIMELNLDALIPHIKTPSYESLNFGPAAKVVYKSFSVYPFITRDIAVFVPDSVNTEDVENIITSNGTELLLKHKLFDTFKKDGKTSYAFRMIFQSFERTLTDEEINKIMETISSDMKGNGWEVR